MIGELLGFFDKSIVCPNPYISGLLVNDQSFNLSNLASINGLRLIEH